jgi:lipopolysaccharide transport system ATP-binding protein
MNAGRSALQLCDVSVGFPIGRRLRGKRFMALQGLTLNIEHGEKLGVIGRNGSGKSTLLRLIAGTLVPDTGRIVRDHGLCQLLTLGPGFVQHLDGRENAILSAMLQGMRYRDIVARLDAIRDFAGIGEFFDQPLNTYSSGMVARLGFSVALQLEPDILLLDEVLGVGDPPFREKSRQAIRDRLRSDATVVLVSHDERTVRQFCTSVAWIENGRLLGHGATDEVLSQYRDATGT